MTKEWTIDRFLLNPALALKELNERVAAEPVAAMTTDYLGCEHCSTDIPLIEKIATAGSKGATKVVYLYAAPPAPSVAVKALEFYANPENWIDTPSWDGDPDCITPKAIPVIDDGDGARPCDCGDTARDALIALYAQVQDVAGWQPIETAPKDGSSVLGFWSYAYLGDKEPTTGIEIIEWHDGKFHGWKDRDGVTQDGVYTHWMLLPEAPAAPAKQD